MRRGDQSANVGRFRPEEAGGGARRPPRKGQGRWVGLVCSSVARRALQNRSPRILPDRGRPVPHSPRPPAPPVPPGGNRQVPPAPLSRSRPALHNRKPPAQPASLQIARSRKARSLADARSRYERGTQFTGVPACTVIMSLGLAAYIGSGRQGISQTGCLTIGRTTLQSEG